MLRPATTDCQAPGRRGGAFTRTYSRDDDGADPLLRDRLIHGLGQQQAVLAWIVEGTQIWYEAGCALPDMPAAVSTATQEWRKGCCDVIFDFVADTLCSKPTGFVESEDLRQSSTTSGSAWMHRENRRLSAGRNPRMPF
jgi:phage/plasmid-associated DNA primase